MGIHIFCDNCNYYSSCNKWNTIKYNLFFYCLQYIKKNNIVIFDDGIDYDIRTTVPKNLINPYKFFRKYTIFKFTTSNRNYKIYMFL